MNTTYNKDNIFARVIRRELPSNTLYEDDILLIIEDKFPDKRYKTHLLCLPKNDYVDFNDFASKSGYVDRFFKSLRDVLDGLGLKHYKLVINNGADVGQEIMHLHIHIKSHDLPIIK